jgi:hypothetical protein
MIFLVRGKTHKAVRTILADPSDGGGDQLDAEQVGHQSGEALFRQQLIVQQIQHERADPFATAASGISPRRSVVPGWPF